MIKTFFFNILISFQFLCTSCPFVDQLIDTLRWGKQELMYSTEPFANKQTKTTYYSDGVMKQYFTKDNHGQSVAASFTVYIGFPLSHDERYQVERGLFKCEDIVEKYYRDIKYIDYTGRYYRFVYADKGKLFLCYEYVIEEDKLKLDKIIDDCVFGLAEQIRLQPILISP